MKIIAAFLAALFLALLPTEASAAVSIVAGSGSGSSQTASGSSGATSYNAPTTATTQSGDVFVIGIRMNGSQTLTSIAIGSDTCTVTSSAIAIGTVNLYYCVIVTTTGYASGTNVVITVSSTQQTNWAIWTFRGVNTSTPRDATATTTFPGQTATTSVSMTTGGGLANNGEAVIGFVAETSGGTYSADAFSPAGGGITVTACNTSICHAGWNLYSGNSGSTVTHSYTTTVSSTWAGFLLALQPSGATNNNQNMLLRGAQ